MPKIRIRVESNRNDNFNYIPPCFNSGFIGITTDLAPKLADCWFHCWQTINDKGLVKHNRLAKSLIEEYPEIHKLMKNESNWQFLLDN